MARFWIGTFLNSASNVENVSVSTSQGKKMPVQNLTPAISVIIIALLVWRICFFAETAVSTGRERVVGPSKIISVKSVVSENDNPPLSPL